MPGENLPTPDPTPLTTDQLDRSEERMLREVENSARWTEAKVEGYEKECTEKFRSTEQRFALVERQRVEQKTDTERSVDAAFSAAKEAVKEQTTASDRAIAKSETSMLEQLKQLGSTFDTSVTGLRRDIDDLKERVGDAEGRKTGGQEVKEQRGVTTSQALTGVGIGLSALFGLAALVISAAP